MFPTVESCRNQPQWSCYNWRDSVTRHGCRSDRMARIEGHRNVQQYLCKNCDARSPTRLAQSSLIKEFCSIRGCSPFTHLCDLLYFLCQLQFETEVASKTIYRSIKRSMHLCSVLPDRLRTAKYLLPPKKAASATHKLSRGLFTHGRVSLSSDKPPAFVMSTAALDSATLLR
jgi:hypothetical protein